jgi:two-component sensor histidine kinase
MPGSRADDLTLVAHELAANAVRHSAGHGRQLLWYPDGTLLCQ